MEKCIHYSNASEMNKLEEMEVNSIHSGILSVKIQSLLKSKQHNNLWCVLYNGRGPFTPRIDLYDDIASVGKVPCRKTIYIEDAKWTKVESVEPSFSFEVKHNQLYTFVTASTSELRLWILILCCVSKDLFNARHILGIEELCKMNSYYINENGDEIFVQDNILYSSSNELSSFMVVADKSDGCIKCDLKGLYKMQVGQGAVRLFQHNTEDEIIHWPLSFLKKFGHSLHTAFLETGSRSATGAGKFIFFTTEGEIINQRLEFEAKFLHAQGQKLEDNSIARGAAVIAELRTSTVKAKPPPPPKKPNSSSFRKSGSEIYEDQQCMSDQQPSKKNTPHSGYPIFPPLTAQTSNLRLSDSVKAFEPQASNSEGLNGIDHTSNSHLQVDPIKSLLARSVSTQSSESENKKGNKKVQKEIKKEQKKREQEEKKERKKREEEEKKRQKKKEEEEKKSKKERKKSQKKTNTKSSISSQSSLNDSSRITSEYSEAGDYSEINYGKSSTQAAPDNSNSEKIYSEPWGILPFMPVLSGGNCNEVEYAQPEKKSVGKMASIEPRDIVHTENYVECQVVDSYCAPALIPPKWEQEDCADTSVYSHLNNNELTVTQQESVYGIASASDTAPVSEDENPYEDASIPS